MSRLPGHDLGDKTGTSHALRVRRWPYVLVEAMLAQHLATEENTLYAAVVALREGALLLRRMADEPGGQKGEELRQEGQKRQAHAEAIRQILNDSPSVTLD